MNKYYKHFVPTGIELFGNKVIAIRRRLRDHIIDLDGNEYGIIRIGDQEWMTENLRVTQYADATPIPNLTSSGCNTWYLPSNDELGLMYNNLHMGGLGGFANAAYWSSSESSATEAWQLDFSTGFEDEEDKGTALHVRAFRMFQSINIYALGTVGPMGGRLFYAEDDGFGLDDLPIYLYWEAHATDQSVSQSWSDVVDVAIGTTGTTVGMGEYNTADIVAQAGHTDSAAKLCDDLVTEGWLPDTTGAYCWYDNDIINKPYGAMYNWYATVNASVLSHFTRNGVYQADWRVPILADMETLITFAGGAGVAGGKLKETGFTHWLPPNIGATDDYRFKGMGGGNRFCDTGRDEGFYGFKIYSDFLAAEEADELHARSYWFSFNGIGASAGSFDKYCGQNVRCMRDI